MLLARLAGQFARCAPAASASSSTSGGGVGAQWARRKLRDYQFVEIKSQDCDHSYISGWGPGGSKVNAAQNAVQLTHKPTGVVVKVSNLLLSIILFYYLIVQVHESRLLQQNVTIAYERLKYAVDRHLNGEKCYEEQLVRLQRDRESKAKRARAKRRANQTSSNLADEDLV